MWVLSLHSDSFLVTCSPFFKLHVSRLPLKVWLLGQWNDMSEDKQWSLTQSIKLKGLRKYEFFHRTFICSCSYTNGKYFPQFLRFNSIWGFFLRGGQHYKYSFFFIICNHRLKLIIQTWFRPDPAVTVCFKTSTALRCLVCRDFWLQPWARCSLMQFVFHTPLEGITIK